MNIRILTTICLISLSSFLTNNITLAAVYGYEQNVDENIVPVLSNLQIEQINNNQVKLTWDVEGDDNVDYYRIERKVDGDEFFTSSVFTTTNKYAYDAGLTPTITYIYRVF